MEGYILETCIDSVESAIAAERGGANRLELCGNLIIGGTTPSPALYQEVRRNCGLKIHALIRPRFGDFCYTGHEFQIIRGEVKMFRELGADGVVIGCLHPDGALNLEQMRMLVEEAGNMSVTLHRAFDVCRNPYEALEAAVGLGINTILTSGQANTCLAGRKLLAELAEQAAGRIDILVGSGVDAAVIRELYPQVKTQSYHMSGKMTLESKMEYRKEGVNMGLPSFSEFEIWRTSEEKIREAAEVLRGLQNRQGGTK
ncbi:copper homeostasis protein CutC [Lachnospiraceae bacterium 46-15]